MPECLLLGSAAQTFPWRLALENLGEHWRCTAIADADTALALLRSRFLSLTVICAGQEGFVQALQTRPPLSPPWLITERPCPGGDALFTLQTMPQLPAWLDAQERSGMLPRLCPGRHMQLLCLARGLMTTLDVPLHLRVWPILPDMAALCAVHPPLLEDLRARLYPLMGRRHGLTPAAVERRLRLAIESTWNHADLAALERFFGHSVDPERGKPTNREFLCQVRERLHLAGQRIV